MIQAAPNGRVPTATASIDRPFGFARPKAPPLSVAESVGPAGEDAPGPAPNGFAPPDEPSAPLASIEPAPSQRRDPVVPFVAGSAADESPSWHPTQPLPLSTSAMSTGPAEVNAIPPRLAGPALDQLPPPTGLPAGVPPSPYPANSYAVGPYPGYPPGQGAPGYQGQPSGARPPGRPAQQPITFQNVLQASNIGVLTALMAGMLWTQVAPFALLAAALIAIFRSSPGKILVLVAAVVVLLVTFVWYAGYLATSQWQATAQLLCTICLVGVPLVAYQSLRRWT